jgi:hypothetical protein
MEEPLDYRIELDADGRRRAVFADGSFTYWIPEG